MAVEVEYRWRVSSAPSGSRRGPHSPLRGASPSPSVRSSFVGCGGLPSLRDSSLQVPIWGRTSVTHLPDMYTVRDG